MITSLCLLPTTSVGMVKQSVRRYVCFPIITVDNNFENLAI